MIIVLNTCVMINLGSIFFLYFRMISTHDKSLCQKLWGHLSLWFTSDVSEIEYKYYSGINISCTTKGELWWLSYWFDETFKQCITLLKVTAGNDVKMQCISGTTWPYFVTKHWEIVIFNLMFRYVSAQTIFLRVKFWTCCAYAVNSGVYCLLCEISQGDKERCQTNISLTVLWHLKYPTEPALECNMQDWLDVVTFRKSDFGWWQASCKNLKFWSWSKVRRYQWLKKRLNNKICLLGKKANQNEYVDWKHSCRNSDEGFAGDDAGDSGIRNTRSPGRSRQHYERCFLFKMQTFINHCPGYMSYCIWPTGFHYDHSKSHRTVYDCQ